MARKKKGKELSMRKIREVLRLTESGDMSVREIARSCSISHATVIKYLRLSEERGVSYSRIAGLRLAEKQSPRLSSNRPLCWHSNSGYR